MARARARSANPRAALAHALNSPRGALPLVDATRESVIDLSLDHYRAPRPRAKSGHQSFEGREKKEVRNKMEAERERFHDDCPSHGQVPG
ncbi:hypothetical protein QQF64_002917 [Cirrhinus molitorella]|uniref:Uncharacterized protein n=1 Tax=Cirrhinus molitorella TaxID=172907 RepID=A0ABR3MRH7_9TELE